MVVNVNNKISTKDLDIIKSNLTVYFSKLGKEYFNEFRYKVKLCPDKAKIYKELVMYQWVLTHWKQHSDGTPIENKNKISLADFNIMIERIKFLIT
jgi:hypothetical protein